MRGESEAADGGEHDELSEILVVILAGWTGPLDALMVDVDGGGSELISLSWKVAALQTNHYLLINIHIFDRSVKVLMETGEPYKGGSRLMMKDWILYSMGG